jgi:superfamily II DNA/RNA helicase
MMLLYCSRAVRALQPALRRVARRSVARTATQDWEKLGIGARLVEAVDAMGLDAPTDAQRDAIPGVLNGEDLLFAAETGSGKTLAYLLPTIARLKAEEFNVDKLDELRRPNRPRALVLVPTRELAAQVQAVAKELSHHAKLSVRGAFGGSDGVGKQRNTLKKGGAYDLLIATPGRFEKLWDLGDVHLSKCSVVVVDEVDTMLSQGFGAELEKVLKATTERERPATVVTTTATLTKAVRRAFGDLSEREERWRFLPELRTVETRGLHKATDRCRLELVDVVGKDKLEELLVVLKKRQKCLIFCNTVNSCRAAEHFLSERNACETFSYHGELNSREREASLKAFRDDERDGALVCTDLAARGLDIPDVDHVIMFDFPRNPVDYLHRAGRTARAGKSGRVTALVAKADRVLASAIQRAVLNGEPVDALSADKKAYLKGGALHVPSKSAKGRARRDLSRARKPKPKTRRSR